MSIMDIRMKCEANRNRTFLGHPRGLAFLVSAEMFERFSFAGMQSLLVLYMVQFLLLPAHAAHVAGLARFRIVIESIYGPLSPAALASVIYGLYAGGVYLTPLGGGLLADRFLGRTATVALGAILTAIGHFLMAFETSFLVALACLLVGVGCFKANIASQVGALYRPGDLRRSSAFQLFLLGVNVAAIIAPLVCGTLGQTLAWHWGFLAAGGGIGIGLAVYLSGLSWLPPEPSRRSAGGARPGLTPGEGRTVLVLVALLPALMLAAVGNLEIFNAYLVWGATNYDLVFFGRTMPVTWLVSLDAFVSSGLLALSLLFWRWWARSRHGPNEITKLAIGISIAATAPLLLAAASVFEAASGHKVGLGWGIAFHVVNALGFVTAFPAGQALFSRVAPRAVSGLMMAVYFLHLFVANMLVGLLGGLLDRMSPADFWLLHAVLVATGALLLLFFRAIFRGTLAPTIDRESAASL